MAEFKTQIKSERAHCLGQLGIAVARDTAPPRRRKVRGNLDLPYDWERALPSAIGDAAKLAAERKAEAMKEAALKAEEDAQYEMVPDGHGGRRRRRRRRRPRQATATPIFTPSGGTFDSSVEIWISSDTPGSLVYYCIDQEWAPSSAVVGSEDLFPFEHESLDAQPITLANQGYKTYRLQAFAMKPHYDDSPVAEASFTVKDPDPDRKFHLAGPSPYVYDNKVDVCPDWDGRNRKEWLRGIWQEWTARRTRAADADAVFARWRPENLDFESFWRNMHGSLPPHIEGAPEHVQKRFFDDYFRGSLA